MFKTLKHLFSMIAVILVVAAASLAQATTTTQQPADNYVTASGFKNKVFEVKYRDPSSLANVLTRLTSGFKGAGITPNAEFKTLTVRDFPENIAEMVVDKSPIEVQSAYTSAPPAPPTTSTPSGSISSGAAVNGDTQKTLRMEIQTKNPNIRIIWLAPRDAKSSSPNSRGI